MKKIGTETKLLHRTFVLSIGGKGLFGLIQVLGAIAALIVTPAQIQAFTLWITGGLLAENPNNVVALYLISASNHVTSATTLWVSIYLILHGLTKVVLVVALLRDKMWAYPAMLVALGVFIVTQTIQMSASFSWGVLALTLFDLFITWLTWREYRLHKAAMSAKERRANEPPTQFS